MGLLLAFHLGEGRYALPLEQVQEVVEAPRLHFLPRAPKGFLGAINFHGSIVPVLDLVAHLGLSGEGRDARVVVLAPAACAVALAVTALQGVIPVTTAAETETAGEGVELLDTARLRESLERLIKGTGGNHGA
jgi:purine-binding chemotaxis protein CheW